jgi:hypothetical protein
MDSNGMFGTMIIILATRGKTATEISPIVLEIWPSLSCLTFFSLIMAENFLVRPSTSTQ